MIGLMDFIHYDFLLYTMLGVFFLSLLCGILSPLLVAKKLAFLGEGVSHSTLLGISISYCLLELQTPLGNFLLTLLITLFLACFLALATFRQNIPNDSTIGIFMTVTLALGVIIFQRFSTGQVDLLSFLFGNLLLMTPLDLLFLGILFVLVMAVIVAPIKSWMYLCYDEQGARLSGINTKVYHYTLIFLLTFLIVSSVKLAGVILVNTLLLIPGVLSYKIGRSMKQVFLISIIFSLTTSLIGLVLANYFSFPIGPCLAVFQFVSFLVIIFLIRLKRSFK